MTSNLNPSYAHRWVKCGGSIRLLDKRLPADDRTAANEGIEAEKVAYSMLKGDNINCTDTDMLEGAQVFCDTVLNVTKGELSKVIIQGSVTCPLISKNCIGSPDAYFYDKTANVIHIFDYKFGHRFVDAFENWQLICYAAGLLSNLNYLPEATFKLWIIQPRNYNYQGSVRSWEVTIEQLKPYFSTLNLAAKVANSDNAPCVTGSHCYGCHAAHCCDSLRDSGMSSIDLADFDYYDLPSASIGFMLALVQDGIERLKSLEMGLNEDITYRIKMGEQIDGFTLEPKYTNQRWTKSEGELIAIAQLFGIDIKSKSLITPSQAAKLGFPIEGFCKREPKKPELISTKKLLTHINIGI